MVEETVAQYGETQFVREDSAPQSAAPDSKADLHAVIDEHLPDDGNHDPDSLWARTRRALKAIVEKL